MAHHPIVSYMSIAGHPIHPMLIHFPVAALLGLLATDAAWMWTKDPFWARAGMWLVAVGVVGGAISGFIGLIDLVIVPGIRRLIAGWCHAIFAVMMLSVATLNWLLRLNSPLTLVPDGGFYCSILTAVMILLTSLMGGQLVYEHGVGVEFKSQPLKKKDKITT